MRIARPEVPDMAYATARAHEGHGSAYPRRGLVRWLTTTNHKDIGILYIVTSFSFFILGGVLALLMRTELYAPGQTIVDNNAYNRLFSTHGVLELLRAPSHWREGQGVPADQRAWLLDDPARGDPDLARERTRRLDGVRAVVDPGGRERELLDRRPLDHRDIVDHR